MEFLDDKRIRALKKVIKQGTADGPLFAADKDEVVVVTNGCWLMEWPRHLVDTNCKGWVKLLAEQAHKKSKRNAGRLLVNPDWRQSVFREKGTFVGIEEDEPSGLTPQDMIAVLYKKERLLYHYANFDAVDLCAPDAKLKLYKISKRVVAEPIGRVLAVYDGKRIVGAFMNTLP